MKRIVAISCFGIIGMLGMTCLLDMNNSNENAEKITTAIEEKAPTNGETIINNYETTNDLQTALYDVVKETLHDESELKQQQKRYVVNPYFLVNNQGRYYLVCNYDKYNTLANYKIENIANIKVLIVP